MLTLTACNQFSAWTSYTGLDTEKEYVREDIADLDEDFNLRALNYGSTTGSSKYMYIFPQKINITDITISKIDHNITNSNIDLFGESGVRVSGINVFSANLTFNWEYKFYNTYKGKGVLQIKSPTFDYKKYYRFGKQSPIVMLEYGKFEIYSLEIKGKSSKDKHIKKLIKKSLQKYLNDKLYQLFTDDINKYLVEYYDQSKPPATDFVTYSPINHIYLDNTMTQPQKNLRNGFLNYITGKISLNESNFASYPQNATTWDNFNETDGSNQVFIHKVFLEEYLNKHVENGIKFVINDDIMSDNTTFALEVDSMKEFYPAIMNLRPSDEEIYINTTVTNALIDITNSNTINMVFRLNLEFKSEKDSNLLFESSFNLNVIAKPKITKSLGFNIELVPELTTLSDVTIPSNYIQVNKSIIEKYLLEGFQTYFKEYPTNLFLEDYPIGDLMSHVFETRLLNEGILIIGETKSSKYNFKVDNEIDKIFSNELGKAEKVFKFLG